MVTTSAYQQSLVWLAMTNMGGKMASQGVRQWANMRHTIHEHLWGVGGDKLVRHLEAM